MTPGARRYTGSRLDCSGGRPPQWIRFQGVWTMTLQHSHRYARALVIGAVVVSGFAFAASPAAASTAGPGATGPTCGPKTVTQFTAPGVGQQAVYNVRRAGTVTLLEVSTTTLRVTDADAASGWKDTVLVMSGSSRWERRKSRSASGHGSTRSGRPGRSSTSSCNRAREAELNWFGLSLLRSARTHQSPCSPHPHLA
jgi:hypothetical protein